MNSFQKVRAILSKEERRKIYWLLLPASVTAMINVIGIAFIAPFVAVASDPHAIEHHAKLAWIYNGMHFTSLNHFLLFLGVSALALLVLVNVLNAFTVWLNIRVLAHVQSSLAYRIFRQYLANPYVFFLSHNGASLSNNVFHVTRKILDYVLKSCVGLVSTALVISFVIGLLIIVEPVLAAGSMLVIGGAYASIYIFVRRKLNAITKEDVRNDECCFRVVSEAFGGIKVVKLLNSEDQFLARFWAPQKNLANNRAALECIQQIPKYALEIVAFGGVLSLIIYLLAIDRNFYAIMPIMALYVFAGYRLMPAVQLIFIYLTYLKASASELDVVYQCLGGVKHDTIQSIKPKPEGFLVFNDSLELSKLSFQYPSSPHKVIDQLDLAIKVNTTVGFVGSTGSGKTTTIDIILGLLVPTNGSIKVDGIELTDDNRPLWQKNLAYVPQQIYLCDDSITRNIAFGLADDQIDMVAVKKAAQLAAIDDFIEQKLANGYDTEVGERGVRLSGGQRQRIGIARALYDNPSVLVMDEATSALDGATEDVIMEAIHNLAHQKTIIIVAHRLSTVAACDIVYFLEDGKVQDQGSFSELLERNIGLRNMAKLT